MKKRAVYTRLGLLAGIATCVIGLSACRSSSNTSHWSYASASGGRLTAEDLLDSDGGNWKMVEEQDDSPLTLHEMAKKGQDPRNMRGMKHEGLDYELAENGEQTYQRTVRLVRDGSKPQDEVIELAGMMPARTDLIMDSGSVPPTPDLKPEFETAQADVPMPERKPEFSEPVQEIAQADVPVPQEKPQFERPAVEVAPLEVAMADVPKPDSKPDSFSAQQFAEMEPAAGDARGGVRSNDAGHIEISQLRFGTHPGKVRMVFDVSGAASFQHNVNNRARELSIQIEDSEWDAGQEAELVNSPLIEGYRAVREGNATRIDMRLKKPVKVLWAAALKPESGKGNRLVVDLAGL